jgi:hypothetical protein
LLWVHGLRNAIVDTSCFSILPYVAGQRSALVVGPAASVKLGEVLKQAIAINCFWSSSRGSNPAGSYSSIPEGSLWLMLVQHALGDSSPQDIASRSASTAPANPTKALSGSQAVPQCSQQHLKNSVKRNPVFDKKMAKLSASRLVKSMMTIAVKRRRLSKKQTVPFNIYPLPVGPRQVSAPKSKPKQSPSGPSNVKQSPPGPSNVLPLNGKLASQGLGWPVLPPHSCECPGSQDFSEARSSSGSFKIRLIVARSQLVE